MANFKEKVKKTMTNVNDWIGDHGATIAFGLGALFVAGIVGSYDKNMTKYREEANADYRGFLDKVLDKVETPEDVAKIEADINEAANEVASENN